MSFGNTSQGLILFLLATSLLAVGATRTIVVGGSENWKLGIDYSVWANQNKPFYFNDTLVFKYDLPSENSTGYSVYLLPNLRSYARCDFRRAKLLANTTQGSGEGFAYVLNKWRPHYFVSGEDNGTQCYPGMMKFFAAPTPARH
ncbi:hypothetical protein DKX38_020591 [Salix brachista]|uniref:Phytocyanin domain-containing protein n=1 Tax=Salix brachista TaxID=2182728 RepID=A0A5N5K8G5_9ROSI|nr:hypothetical protein DKX38_020591 [Salix brachista]